MDPDPDPGGPKTCGSGSATLLFSLDRYLSQSRGLPPSFSLASWLSQFRGLNPSCLWAPYRGLHSSFLLVSYLSQFWAIFLPALWLLIWASPGGLPPLSDWIVPDVTDCLRFFHWLLTWARPFFPVFAGFWYPANNICISLVLVLYTASLPPPPNWVWFDLLIC